MSTLSIENIGKSVQLDGAPVSEARVLREMQNQGMQPPKLEGEAGGTPEVTFGKILENSLDQVNLMQHQADDAVKELVAGRAKNIHETMLTIERADASLKMAMQVRNKILEAYREIMRMQV